MRLKEAGLTATNFLFPLYAGLIGGVSFLATIAKFQSQHSTMSQLVEIGSITFHWLHSLEMVLVLVLAAGSLLARSRWRIVVSALLLAIWLAQEWWLFPSLDANTRLVIAGGTPPASGSHTVFAGIETFKLLMLTFAGVVSASGVARRQQLAPNDEQVAGAIHA